MSIDFANVTKVMTPECGFNQQCLPITSENWKGDGGTTIVDGVVTWTPSSTGFAVYYVPEKTLTVYAGHKYYMTADVKAETASKLSLSLIVSGGTSVPNTTVNEWQTLSKRTTPTADKTSCFLFIVQNKIADGTTCYVRNCMLVDLTEMYGAGNEPSDIATVRADCAARGHNLGTFQAQQLEAVTVSSIADGDGNILWSKP